MKLVHWFGGNELWTDKATANGPFKLPYFAVSMGNLVGWKPLCEEKSGVQRPMTPVTRTLPLVAVSSVE